MCNFWDWGAQLNRICLLEMTMNSETLISYKAILRSCLGWHYKVRLASTSDSLKLAFNWNDKGQSSFDFENDRERKNLCSKDIQHLRKNNQICGTYYLENEMLIANLLKHSRVPFNILFGHICITSYPSHWEVWIQTNWCSGGSPIKYPRARDPLVKLDTAPILTASFPLPVDPLGCLMVPGRRLASTGIHSRTKSSWEWSSMLERNQTEN